MCVGYDLMSGIGITYYTLSKIDFIKYGEENSHHLWCWMNSPSTNYTPILENRKYSGNVKVLDLICVNDNINIS